MRAIEVIRIGDILFRKDLKMKAIRLSYALDYLFEMPLIPPLYKLESLDLNLMHTLCSAVQCKEEIQEPAAYI